jgi:pimeloyl-ACP methyl ester carboxylesterase
MKRAVTAICLFLGVQPCEGFSIAPSSCVSRPLVKPLILSPHQARRNANAEYDDYWDEDKSEDEEINRSGQYKVSFEPGYEEEQEPQLDWEECDDGGWVLLPPSYVSKPTAVLHFCGGTFFGSSPKLWYGPLLEGIVRATQCTIVATAIPVSLVESPLQHVMLSRKLQRQFQSAYVNVLEDEYGDIADVPVVAMGHSLGSRLLAVLATLSPPKNAAAPPYKNYILMSFTNYGASASIPGVQQLVKSRRNLDSPDERPTRTTRQRRRRKYDDEWDDDDFLDEDIDEIIDDLQESVWEQTSEVRDRLTPLPEDLEFYPSPDQLWDALKKDQRFSIPETLIIQFDDDGLDQSARLAEILTNSSDVKYARLRGNHLSPVSVEAKDGSWLELPSKATKALLKIMRGKSTKEKSTDTAGMRDLRQSIARYITDVVTK